MTNKEIVFRLAAAIALATGVKTMAPPSPVTAALRSESQTSQVIEKTIITADNLAQAGIELGPEVEVQWYGNHLARVHRLNSGLETIGLALELDSAMLKGNLFRLSAETAGDSIATRDLGPSQIKTLVEAFPEKVPFFFIDQEALDLFTEETQDVIGRAQNVVIRTGPRQMGEATFLIAAGFLTRWELGAENNLFPSSGNALTFCSGSFEKGPFPPGIET